MTPTTPAAPGPAVPPAAAPRRPLEAVVEYFTLRRARQLRDRMPAPARKSMSEALQLGRQKSDAADALWGNGHTADGLRLAAEALDATVAALEAMENGKAKSPVHEARAQPSDAGTPAVVDSAGGDARTLARAKPSALGDASGAAALAAAMESRAAMLRAQGARAAEIDLLERVIRERAETALPVYDDEVSSSNAALFERLVRARALVDRWLGVLVLEPRDLWTTRSLRIGTVAVLLGAAAAWYLVRQPADHSVEASGTWGDAPAFAPDKAIDGRTDTSWIAPDRQVAWLQVSFFSPRRIERLRLLNASNPPHHDRGTNRYRIEIYGEDGRVLRSIDGEMPYRSTPSWVEHAVGLDRVTRVRFTASSYHRNSAGLSELVWD